MIVHLTARATEGLAPFRNHEQARWVWCRLRSVFPRALACTLMGNHLHLLPEVDSSEHARVKVGVILRSFTRKFPRGRRIFQPVEMPATISDRQKLRRHVRYVALNPSRARLANDPLVWIWSTYRELVGAAARRRQALHAAWLVGSAYP